LTKEKTQKIFLLKRNLVIETIKRLSCEEEKGESQKDSFKSHIPLLPLLSSAEFDDPTSLKGFVFSTSSLFISLDCSLDSSLKVDRFKTSDVKEQILRLKSSISEDQSQIQCKTILL